MGLDVLLCLFCRLYLATDKPQFDRPEDLMAEPTLSGLGWDGLDVLPGPPDDGLKRCILAAYLENPFLDEDLSALCLRLGTDRAATAVALESLCRDRFLLEAGTRGHALELAAVPSNVHTEKILSLPLAEPPAQAVDETSTEPLPQALRDLVEALPYGAFLLDAAGTPLAANTLSSEWSGIPLAELDAGRVLRDTGIDPLQPMDECSVHFAAGRSLVLDVRPYAWEGGDAWLATLRPAAGVSQTQMAFQEELYVTLKDKVVKPLECVESYLDDPQDCSLGAARAALAQINWFLQDLYLTGETPPEE
jgi:PAS domain-containing protein